MVFCHFFCFCLYTINIETTGRYDIKVWASSAATDKYINIYMNGELIGSPDVYTENWYDYVLYDVGEIDLARGINVMKLEFAEGDVNAAAFEINQIG